jgi:hypothetical protein
VSEVSHKRRQASDLLETQERRNFILKARKAGMTYTRCAEAAVKQFGLDRLPEGWDVRVAHKDIARELEKVKSLNNELAEDIKQLEIERLDELWLVLYPRMKGGELAAIDRGIRIMARRAALLGLDEPQRQEVSGPNGGPIPVKAYTVISPDDWDEENGE